MPDTNMTVAEPDRPAVGSLPALGSLPLANAWAPTEAEAATLDRLAEAIGSAWGAAWNTNVTDTGQRFVGLDLLLPVWPEEVCVAFLVERQDRWVAFDPAARAADEPEAEAGSLPELAAMLGERWAPERWALATATE
jgi:hypothetical protein